MSRFKSRILAFSVCLIPWCCPIVAQAHRQYDPGKRRFAQRDPQFGRRDKGSPYVDGLNAYTYVRCMPLTGNDPTGLQCTTCYYSTGIVASCSSANNCDGMHIGDNCEALRNRFVRCNKVCYELWVGTCANVAPGGGACQCCACQRMTFAATICP